MDPCGRLSIVISAESTSEMMVVPGLIVTFWSLVVLLGENEVATAPPTLIDAFLFTHVGTRM